MAGLTYKDAGVDTKEGERAVSLMKEHVKKTFNENVLTGLGGFGGLFKLPLGDMEEPILVSGTDGVGTKLKLAFMMDKHDTVGIDCVAMCVNDILCQGATPLIFLDYIATGKVKAESVAEIVKGIARGCQEAKSALIGGETAEMPNFYQDGEYDIAGFSVGIVDRKNLITGDNITEDMAIVGLSSSGIHSNGYSLVRKIFFEKFGMNTDDFVEELNETLGEALLRPTKIYVKEVEAIRSVSDIKGIVHITGGGFFENIPRILPDGIGVQIDKSAWDKKKIFIYMQEKAGIDEKEMYSTFNMGIGMMLIMSKEDAQKAIEAVKAIGEKAYLIGKTIKIENASERVNLI